MISGDYTPFTGRHNRRRATDASLGQMDSNCNLKSPSFLLVNGFAFLRETTVRHDTRRRSSFCLGVGVEIWGEGGSLYLACRIDTSYESKHYR